MKKLRLLTRFIAMATLVAWMGACEGPAGPTGPQGPAGPQGETGAAGPAGATGTANVIYSNWAPASTWGTWTKTNINGRDRYYIDVAAAPLSQRIIDQGAVLVYMKHPTDNNQARQLPVSVIAQFTEELVDFSLPQVGRIRLWSTPISGPVVPTLNYQFRYVLIPGGQAARLNLEGLTYEEAKTRFNLPD